MRRLLLATAATTIALGAPTLADRLHAPAINRAGWELTFLNGQHDWLSLSDEAKAAYAAAVFDEFSAEAVGSNIALATLEDDRDCVLKLQATPQDIAKLITTRYANVPAERNGSPAAVLGAYLFAGDFCGELTFEMGKDP